MQRLTQWLEHRWVNPAYVGWLLLGLALFFFGAATNTMAGWLYVMSGVMLAMLLVAAVLPPRNLQGLVVTRSPIRPVTAQVPLEVELTIRNGQRQSKGMFQVIDRLPPSLGESPVTAVDSLAGGTTHTWRYPVPTTRRGIYQWPGVDLRTAAPMGLFWSRRSQPAPATAVVYPQVLPLQRCPLIDTVGPRHGQHWRYSPAAQADTQGVTRALRPYRWGDPTRLIHWRTSARYGELRVRELETMTASREVVIALNTAARWAEADFEQAVVAAASLFAYAHRRGFTAALWLPSADSSTEDTLLRDTSRALHVLAGVEPWPGGRSPSTVPQAPTLWLTPAGSLPAAMGNGSRAILWGAGTAPARDSHTLPIDPNLSLDAQLQADPR